MLTYPSFLDVLQVVVLSELCVESLRLGEREPPLTFGPAGKIPLGPKEMAV